MSDEKLTLGEALRTIAERTSFQTEEQGAAVLATIDEHIREVEGDGPDIEHDQADQADAPDERDAKIADLERQLAEARGGVSDSSAVPGPSHSPGVKSNGAAPIKAAKRTTPGRRA